MPDLIYPIISAFLFVVINESFATRFSHPISVPTNIHIYTLYIHIYTYIYRTRFTRCMSNILSGIRINYKSYQICFLFLIIINNKFLKKCVNSTSEPCLNLKSVICTTGIYRIGCKYIYNIYII